MDLVSFIPHQILLKWSHLTGFWWAMCIVCIGEKRNCFKILVKNLKRLTTSKVWVQIEECQKIGFREIVLEVADWIYWTRMETTDDLL